MKNREIKFRAWDKEEEKMSESFGFGGNNSIDYKDIKGVHMIAKDDLDCVEIELMQFTGLKDKNGVEIYEGDICLFKTKSYATKTQNFNIEIVYFNDRFVGKIPNKKVINYMSLWMETLEVIGNIYQNPDLLK